MLVMSFGGQCRHFSTNAKAFHKDWGLKRGPYEGSKPLKYAKSFVKNIKFRLNLHIRESSMFYHFQLYSLAYF